MVSHVPAGSKVHPIVYRFPLRRNGELDESHESCRAALADVPSLPRPILDEFKRHARLKDEGGQRSTDMETLRETAAAFLSPTDRARLTAEIDGTARRVGRFTTPVKRRRRSKSDLLAAVAAGLEDGLVPAAIADSLGISDARLRVLRAELNKQAA
jgi:hypothetical protein